MVKSGETWYVMLLPIICLNINTTWTWLNNTAKVVAHCLLSVLISALKVAFQLRMSIKQSILVKARRGKPKCYEQKRKQVLTRKAITRNKMKFAQSYREEKVTLNKKKESSEG
jgi:hypothetical protein